MLGSAFRQLPWDSPVSCDIRRGKPRSQTCKKENTASSNPKITYQAGVGGFKWTFCNYPTDVNRALVVAK
ncbi:hypothetical protein At12D13_35950 [Agrobacterium fabrum]|nr:hypothetical protein At12D13_35950 [Agrobacterium fabrum]